MELASSICLSDGEALVTAITKGGGEKTLKGSDLFRFGLPKADGRTKMVQTDFSSWRRESIQEYSFAVARPIEVNESHAVWSFLADGYRFVVPALALMRCLVAGEARILPKLFRPQSLDDVYDFSDAKQVTNFRLAPRPTQTSELRSLLSWLACFPSARRLWASAYLSAMNERLDLELPNARVTFTVWEHGSSPGRNCYVAGLRLEIIQPLESPFDFASDHLREIRPCTGKPLPPTKPQAKPAHEAETNQAAFEVSDKQWSIAEPILGRAKGPQMDLRVRLNCVMRKLLGQETWAEVGLPYKIKANNLIASFTAWRSDGRWEKLKAAIPELNELLVRNSPSGRQQD